MDSLGYFRNLLLHPRSYALYAIFFILPLQVKTLLATWEALLVNLPSQAQYVQKGQMGVFLFRSRPRAFINDAALAPSRNF